MRETVYGYPLVDVIKILEYHGYEVRHKSEGKRKLEFGRTHPLPRGEEEFKKEALERIRQQITLDDLKFSTEKIGDGPSSFIPWKISRATLRIF
ncbi:hypothetical protein [Bradyrhizobium sp. DASA03007]|uniref:hypothetical protein n=1 Tax=unclassified Bradyrhizobium TaxID=2631580 RepID=UPI003F6F2AD7